MKQVYSTDNRIEAMNYKNVIENSGIEVTIKNEYSAGGTVPVQNLWLELWVDANDYDQAVKALDNINTEIKADDWTCTSCNEKNDSTFQVCWNCQTPDKNQRL